MNTERSAAEVLRNARTAAGWTQARVSRRSGVPVPSISAYENGRREPTVAMLQRLLRPPGRDLTTEARWDSARSGAAIELVVPLTDELPVRRRGALKFPPVPAG